MAPCKNQLKAMIQIFSYPQEFLVCKIQMDHQEFDLSRGLQEPDEEFKSLYPDAYNELDIKQLEFLGNLLLTGVLFDSNHAQDKVTNWLCTSVMV